MSAPRISFANVCVDFQTERGPLRVVDDVADPASAVRTLANFVVDARQPGAVPA